MESTRDWANSLVIAESRARIGRRRIGSGRVRPNLAEIEAELAEIRRDQPILGQRSTDVQLLPEPRGTFRPSDICAGAAPRRAPPRLPHVWAISRPGPSPHRNPDCASWTAPRRCANHPRHAIRGTRGHTHAKSAFERDNTMAALLVVDGARCQSLRRVQPRSTKCACPECTPGVRVRLPAQSAWPECMPRVRTQTAVPKLVRNMLYVCVLPLGCAEVSDPETSSRSPPLPRPRCASEARPCRASGAAPRHGANNVGSNGATGKTAPSACDDASCANEEAVSSGGRVLLARAVAQSSAQSARKQRGIGMLGATCETA